VLAFASAREVDGGSGAILVLLKGSSSSRSSQPQHAPPRSRRSDG
jgi:hypothetical protein